MGWADVGNVVLTGADSLLGAACAMASLERAANNIMKWDYMMRRKRGETDAKYEPCFATALSIENVVGSMNCGHYVSLAGIMARPKKGYSIRLRFSGICIKSDFAAPDDGSDIHILTLMYNTGRMVMEGARKPSHLVYIAPELLQLAHTHCREEKEDSLINRTATTSTKRIKAAPPSTVNTVPPSPIQIGQ